MVLTEDGYRKRLVDEEVDLALHAFGAVSIEGPKWCGKTWVALNHAESKIMLNDPANDYANLRRVQIDIETAFEGKRPHLIDEWQMVPSLWDATKFKVDFTQGDGNFILTGSSTVLPEYKHHSGAGRIGRIRMRPMSLFESGDSNGEVSLVSLFERPEKLCSSMQEIGVRKLIDLSVRGGWPKNVGKDVRYAAIAVKEYLSTIIEDASRLDSRYSDMRKIELTLRSLARNETTLATTKKIVADVAEKGTVYLDHTKRDRPSKENVSYKTVEKYIDILSRLYIIEDQPSFSPSLRSSVNVGKTVKRHLADPSLAVAAMGYTPEKLLGDMNTFGYIFESMCERDLDVYIRAHGGRLMHYRDAKGREIDAVVELPDGRWGAIEIKLGHNQVDSAAKELIKTDRWMKENDIPNPASFLCVICGMSEYAYRRDDGVYVVPITMLRD